MEKYFEKFEVIEVLKKDGHATVYLANHIFLGKKIILKTLNTKEISDPAIVNRFKREAKILARLDHPNIIKILEAGEIDDKELPRTHYIAMEYWI